MHFVDPVKLSFGVLPVCKNDFENHSRNKDRKAVVSRGDGHPVCPVFA